LKSCSQPTQDEQLASMCGKPTRTPRARRFIFFNGGHSAGTRCAVMLARGAGALRISGAGALYT
jgi:hypothetical protein